MARNYAALPHEYLEEMALLSDAEFGQLCRALLQYSRDGELPELDSVARLMLPRVRMQEDRFQASYEAQVEQRRAAGRKSAKSRANEEQRESTEGNEAQRRSTKANKTETQTDTKTDTETKPLPPSEEGDGKRARFTPPTLEQVREYVAQRGSRVDPQGFLDFYASKGWMIGKTPMKDWKAACRNAEAWERWEREPVCGQIQSSAPPAAVYNDAHERNLRFLEQLRSQ